MTCHRNPHRLTNWRPAAKLSAAGPEIVRSAPQIASDFAEGDTSSYGVASSQRHWRVSDHAIKVELIKRGLGWGNVPLDLAASDIRAGALAVLAVHGLPERTQCTIGLHRPRARVHGPVCSAIWSAAQNLIATEQDAVSYCGSIGMLSSPLRSSHRPCRAVRQRRGVGPCLSTRSLADRQISIACVGFQNLLGDRRAR